jgi:putative transposase
MTATAYFQRRRRLLARVRSADRRFFTCKAMFFWAKRAGMKLHFIQLGKPIQNAFVESFNGKFPQYCLDLYWFASLEDAHLTIESWRAH